MNNLAILRYILSLSINIISYRQLNFVKANIFKLYEHIFTKDYEHIQMYCIPRIDIDTFSESVESSSKLS